MNRFERWSVWTTAIATAVTGIVYFWLKYLISSEDPWSVINHPMQPWVLKAHIIVAPALVFALGLITMRHVWKHFRTGQRWGRRSGVITGLVTAPMILTGYLIQAVTHLGWLKALALSHTAFGLVFAVGLLMHQLFLRRPPPASDDLPIAATRARVTHSESEERSAVHAMLGRQLR